MRRTVTGAVVTALAVVMTTGVGPASADVIATVPLPQCCPSQEVAIGGSVFSIDLPPGGFGPEQPTLVRIDPATSAITGTATLPSGLPAGTPQANEMVAASGSLWITEYFQNEVVRIDPQSMAITAVVSTGRSPSSIVFDGRSLWVALQNQRSVVRIDPTRNAVVQSVSVGSKDTSDGPFQLAVDGTQVLASMAVSGRVARIDPTGKVRYDAVGHVAANCALLITAPGGYWLDDTGCSNSYYRWDDARKRITATVGDAPAQDWGAVVVGNYLYTAQYDCGETCSDGQLVKRDATTGTQLAAVDTGEEAFLVSFAANSFWVGDWDASALVRVANF